MARPLSLHACLIAETRDAAAPRPQRFSKTAHKLKASVSIPENVSAVRLRIEMGGAFADLLNEKGKGSGENEMGYVGRTLGFWMIGNLDWSPMWLEILRIGFYEILKLEMPPYYAVVDERRYKRIYFGPSMLSLTSPRTHLLNTQLVVYINSYMHASLSSQCNTSLTTGDQAKQ